MAVGVRSLVKSVVKSIPDHALGTTVIGTENRCSKGFHDQNYAGERQMPGKPKLERTLIKLSGADVAPETVRASDLAEFLIQLEKAILATVMNGKDFTLDAPQQDLKVSLVSIEPGSESLAFALTSDVMSGVSLLSRAYYERNYSTIPLEAQQSLHEISKQAASQSWEVEFVENEQFNIPRAIISDDNPVPAPKVIVAQGDTTIYGRLIRVGGVSPRAMLEMPDGRYLYIELAENMAVTLASKERLYKDVGIEGTATWRVDTWELIRFKANRITKYQPSKHNIVTTFEDLAEAAGDRWIGIDVEQLIAEMRGRAKS